MVLKRIIYFKNGKKEVLNVKLCNNLLDKSIGLMFKKNSAPLLFTFKKEKILRIHSFFCYPFTAIWLDDKMNSTKIIKVDKWRFNLSGYGKYLLEIPLKTTKQ